MFWAHSVLRLQSSFCQTTLSFWLSYSVLSVLHVSVKKKKSVPLGCEMVYLKSTSNNKPFCLGRKQIIFNLSVVVHTEIHELLNFLKTLLFPHYSQL